MKRAKKEQSDKEKIAIVEDILQNGKPLKMKKGSDRPYHFPISL